MTFERELVSQCQYWVGVMSLSIVACGLVVAVFVVVRHAPKRLVTAICSCSSSVGVVSVATYLCVRVRRVARLAGTIVAMEHITTFIQAINRLGTNQ